MLVHIETLTVGAGVWLGIDRHRPLETRYVPAQTGPRLVLVQASKSRPGARLNRFVPVLIESLTAGVGRSVQVPVLRRDRKERCINKLEKFWRKRGMFRPSLLLIKKSFGIIDTSLFNIFSLRFLQCIIGSNTGLFFTKNHYGENWQDPFKQSNLRFEWSSSGSNPRSSTIFFFLNELAIFSAQCDPT